MKKKFSLRIQLTLILLVFIASLLGLIYMFQTVFLDDFYRDSKAKSLESIANTIDNNIQNEDFPSVLDSLTLSNEVCVRIVSSDSDMSSISQNNACALRLLDDRLIDNIAGEVIDNDGEKLFDNFRFAPSENLEPNDLYIYGKMTTYHDKKTLILVSSTITPIGATVSTLKSQYKFIVFVVVVLTVLLAFFISKIILRPVRKMNVEAKNLSKGCYDSNSIKTSNKELSELNNTLACANEDILKADRAKKELLGNVSHDLRTPLTMIVGYGEMIRDIEEENNEDNINVIIDEAKRLSTLVDDLIDISKIEGNGIDLKLSKVSLNDMLSSIYKQYDKYCEAQKVSFELKLQEDVTIECDENRLKQVIYNFINNSLNYADGDDSKIILGVDEDYAVYVYDNGEGIDEDKLDLIWDRYYKIDKEHKRQHIGSGIGLALAKDLLEAHHYEYGVESIKGEYTKFFFKPTIITRKGI